MPTTLAVANWLHWSNPQMDLLNLANYDAVFGAGTEAGFRGPKRRP